MKPERVDLSGAGDVMELARRVLRTRLRETRRLAGALESRDARALHGFRIAGKRLRYALERFEDLEPALRPAAEALARLQDALGEAHDRDLLLAILPPAMPGTERRLRGDREACVDRAGALWAQAQTLMRACALINFE
jgi:CHAD domain-containing protein